MPFDELTETIKWAEDGKTNAEIVDRVERHLVPELQWIADATYVMGYIHDISITINFENMIYSV